MSNPKSLQKNSNFLKSDVEKRYVLGVVYEPDIVDAQGDYAMAEDIEKACWRFMKNLTLGSMHNNWDDGIGEIVENYIAPVDMILGDQIVKKGSWLIGAILSPENFEMVKSGEFTGYSMGGTAKIITED